MVKRFGVLAILRMVLVVVTGLTFKDPHTVGKNMLTY